MARVPTKVRQPAPRKQKVDTTREKEILTYQPLVRRTAHSLRHLIPDSIPTDDLISAGQLGLIEAIDKWDPRGGMNSRQAWYKFTVRQRIIDAFRRANYRWEALQIKSSQASGGRGGKYYTRSYSGNALVKMGNLLIETPSETRPETFVQDIQQHIHMGQIRALLWRYINSTPKQDQRLALASYLDGKKLSELGEQLNISESGACLIRQAAVRELRRRLEADGLGLADLLGS